MTLKHSCLLTSGFTILAVVATFATADAATSSKARTNVIQSAPNQPPYGYPIYPVQQAPDCYLPSDGCMSEYSVQN
jgi:hypothetical protein